MNIGMYNIWDYWSFGILHAIRVTQLGNYDLMIVTETKTLDKVYCKNRLVYGVACLGAVPTAAGSMKGCVVLLMK